MSTTTITTSTLKGVVADHVAAVNAFDTDAVLETFADDALVNDARREFWGGEAIRHWVAEEIVGHRVTIEVTEVIEHHALTIVRARYDGQYDKTGLPEELVLTNYFTVREGRIDSLIVIRNRPAREAGLGDGAPEVVRRYFDHDANRDIAAILALFSDDATVVDEGQTRHGTAEIEAWQTGPASTYNYTTEVLESEPRTANRYAVTGRLTGNFPGGTADLRWDFTVAGDRISRLVIAPMSPATARVPNQTKTAVTATAPPDTTSGSREGRILERVRAIPEGFVRTYGDIQPDAPRLVGRILAAHHVDREPADGAGIPWHRVVHADGRAARGAAQLALLRREGVPIRGDRVDMRHARMPTESANSELEATR